MSKPLISTSTQIMGGTPVFSGTRVPVQTLFDYLESGDTIDDFLDGFPTVSREQVLEFLEAARVRMAAEAE
jgi:uncharacterized protein (DUF433 family)